MQGLRIIKLPTRLAAVVSLAMLIFCAGCGKAQNKLLVAASAGNLIAVKSLIVKGANVNFREEGNTALILAVCQGHTEIVQMLLKEGAEIEINPKDGMTLLVIAAKNGNTEIAQALLDKGADVNAGESDGNTALLQAASNGHSDIVQLLLGRGAHVNAKDKDGHNAFVLADRKGYSQVAEMLRKNGAQVPVVVAPSKPVAPPPPPVHFELVVKTISVMGESSTATLEGGITIAEGGTYDFVDPKSKGVAKYKVQKITENAVVVLYEGKELEFKSQTTLERFKEK